MPSIEKTDRQQLLELQHGKTIEELMEEAVDKHRGKRHSLTHAALELGLASLTFRKWADKFGVDIEMKYGDENAGGETQEEGKENPGPGNPDPGTETENPGTEEQK